MFMFMFMFNIDSSILKDATLATIYIYIYATLDTSVHT